MNRKSSETERDRVAHLSRFHAEGVFGARSCALPERKEKLFVV